MSDSEKFTIQRISKNGNREDTESLVTKELPVTIILNNQELVTLLCSPADLDYMAIGFLFSEGLLKSKREIKNISVDAQRGVVSVETDGNKETGGELTFKGVITSGCGRGASLYSAADVEIQPVDSQIKLSVHEVFELTGEFQHSSTVYLATHGVHSAGLCDRRKILVFSEDVGRHNAVDKIIGECILKDITTKDRIVITSGRISSEVVLKVARAGIPVLISKSVPTNMGVRFAKNLGITLIGFVRGGKMNVYAHEWRVIGENKPLL